MVASVNAVSQGPLVSAGRIRHKCHADLLCAARLIAAQLGPKARLQKVRHPDTDEIRRVRHQSSFGGPTAVLHQTLHIKLSHFGRIAETEIASALRAANEASRKIAGPPVRNITIDLRYNRGGRFDRMLRLAAAFIGPAPRAVHLTGKNGTRKISLPRPLTRLPFDRIELLTGAQTASSAEVFAALLRVHDKALITGKPTFGKNWLSRIIAVTHDWQLLVPGETIYVPGAVLKGGLTPDRP